MPEIQTAPFTFESNVKLTGEKVQLIEFGKSRLAAYNKLFKKHRLTHNIKWN
jgi:hypothetical protein